MSDIEMRILTAEDVIYGHKPLDHLYVDGVDVAGDALEAFIPVEAGVEAVGWVIVITRDENGNPVTNPLTNFPIQTLRRGLIRWE